MTNSVAFGSQFITAIPVLSTSNRSNPPVITSLHRLEPIDGNLKYRVALREWQRIAEQKGYGQTLTPANFIEGLEKVMGRIPGSDIWITKTPIGREFSGIAYTENGEKAISLKALQINPSLAHSNKLRSITGLGRALVYGIFKQLPKKPLYIEVKSEAAALFYNRLFNSKPQSRFLEVSPEQVKFFIETTEKRPEYQDVFTTHKIRKHAKKLA